MQTVSLYQWETTEDFNISDLIHLIQLKRVDFFTNYIAVSDLQEVFFKGLTPLHSLQKVNPLLPLTLMGDVLCYIQHKTSKYFDVFSNDLCSIDVDSTTHH